LKGRCIKHLEWLLLDLALLGVRHRKDIFVLHSAERKVVHYVIGPTFLELKWVLVFLASVLAVLENIKVGALRSLFFTEEHARGICTDRVHRHQLKEAVSLRRDVVLAMHLNFTVGFAI